MLSANRNIPWKKNERDAKIQRISAFFPIFVMGILGGSLSSGCSDDSSRSVVNIQDTTATPETDAELTIDFSNFGDIATSEANDATHDSDPSCTPDTPDCTTLFFCKEDLDCASVLGELPTCTEARCDLDTNTCFAATIPAEECDDLVVTPPPNAICKYTGSANSTFECDVEVVRESDAVPGPVSLTFEIYYLSPTVRFVGLRTYPCGDKSCPTEVPPAALVSGHHTTLTPDSTDDWEGIGNVAMVPPDGSPETYLTQAYLETNGNVVGSAVIVTAVFELTAVVSDPVWIEVNKPIASGLQGVTLPSTVTDARIVVGMPTTLPEEICNDEIDNDGDSDVDCADSDCDETPECSQESCGNGTCDELESCESCSNDCGICPETCGNGQCAETETCITCPGDCGECPEVCGNAQCGGDETCTSCAIDCGPCPEICGNSQCAGDETCSTCPSDCGQCPPICGDGNCHASETCTTCAQDCGTCPCDTGPGPVPPLPDGGICQITGCIGDVVDCPLRIAKASAGVDPATGLQFKLTYPGNMLTLENLFTTKCFGPGNCMEAPVAGPLAQPLDTGHVFSVSPTNPQNWAGTLGVVIVNFTSTSVPLTTAYLDVNGALVGDAQFAWARFKLKLNATKLQPALVSIPNDTKNQLVAVSQKQLELLADILNGLIVTFGTL